MDEPVDRAPLVSIIIPAYAPRPEWLLAAVTSALQEPECPIEVIVVDDGSPDPAAHVLAGLGDPRVRSLRVEHVGAYGARNAGIAAARGQFVRFVDADDLVESGSTGRLLVLARGDGGSIAYGATLMCDQDLVPRRVVTSALEGDVSEACVLGRFEVFVVSMVFPRWVIDQAGEWSESDFEVSADWDFVLRCLELAPVRRLDAVVTRYRRHAASITRTASIEAGARAGELVLDRYLRRHPDQRGSALERGAYLRLHLDRARAHAADGSPGAAARHLAGAAHYDAPATGAAIVQGAARVLRDSRFARVRQASSELVVMPPAVRAAISASLDRALAARGVDASEFGIVSSEIVASAGTHARALLSLRPVITGLGVAIPRPGRAELRPVELLAAGRGEVTVEILASALSPGTERAQWLRLPNARPGLPFAPGYSGAGIVLASGAGVPDRPPGTLVAVARARHASLVTLPASWTSPIPDGVALPDAALVYLAIISGYGVDRLGPVEGERVCILGAGTIGMLALHFARLRGAGEIIVVAATRRSEREALAAGAAGFLTLDEDLEEIRSPLVIDATGNPESLAAAVSAARPGGTVVLLGSPRGVTRATPVAEIQRKELTIDGAHISSLAAAARRGPGDPFARLAEEFLSSLAAPGIDMAPLRGQPCDPREIGLLYRRLARHDVRAAHLDWSVIPRRERVGTRSALSTPRLPRTPEDVLAPALRPRAVSRPLRFALIGCGDIGFSNARAIAAAENAELVIAHDQAPDLARAVAARHGCAVADSMAEALNREVADAVLIAVPHHLHAPLVAQAAAAGLHVLVEKPLAIDVAGARYAVHAAARAGVHLSVCFNCRYEPAIRAASRLLELGALGAIRGANVVFHADKPDSYWVGGFSGRATSDWRAHRSTAGGGVFIMNLTHYVDLIRHLGKVELQSVLGSARAAPGAEVEEAVALTAMLEGGGLATLSASAATRGAPANRFELWGEHGTVRIEPDPAIYTERAITGLVPGRWSSLAPGAPDDSRRLLVERFAGAILAGAAPEITPEDALAVQEFVTATYRTIETGTPITVESGLAA